MTPPLIFALITHFYFVLLFLHAFCAHVRLCGRLLIFSDEKHGSRQLWDQKLVVDSIRSQPKEREHYGTEASKFGEQVENCEYLPSVNLPDVREIVVWFVEHFKELSGEVYAVLGYVFLFNTSTVVRGCGVLLNIQEWKVLSFFVNQKSLIICINCIVLEKGIDSSCMIRIQLELGPQSIDPGDRFLMIGICIS